MEAPNRAVLQTTLLKLLANPATDKRLGGGDHYLSQALRAQFPGTFLRPQQIMETVWSLIAQGLAYIDYSQGAAENWHLCLTESGAAAAADEEANPDNAAGFIEALRRRLPHMSPIVAQYAQEAVLTYTARCYLASAVMLGVASEAAFLEMAQAFASWSPPKHKAFLTVLDNPKTNYIQKFTEFRKRIEPEKANLPAEIADGMSLTLDSVLDLLRIYRNDAGHPTGKQVSREDAFTNLQMAVRYLQKIYLLKSHF